MLLQQQNRGATGGERERRRRTRSQLTAAVRKRYAVCSHRVAACSGDPPLKEKYIYWEHAYE